MKSDKTIALALSEAHMSADYKAHIIIGLNPVEDNDEEADVDLAINSPDLEMTITMVKTLLDTLHQLAEKEGLTIDDLDL